MRATLATRVTLCLFITASALPAARELSHDALIELSLAARSGAASPNYFLGLRAYYGTPRDATAALAHFRAAADAEHAPAALALGIMLEGGEGVPPDPIGAYAAFAAAGAGGEPEGLHRAGLMLFRGTAPGAPFDDAERFAAAAALFRRAVAAGFAPAAHSLGTLLEYGAGVVQDWPAAAHLYEQGCDGHLPRTGGGIPSGAAAAAAAAAEAAVVTPHGTVGSSADAEACYALGLMRAYGRGVPQDLSGAALLYQRAIRAGPAGVGHAPAALALGKLHATGQGVPVDYTAALAHLQAAAASGDVRVEGEAAQLYARLDALVLEAEAGTRETLESLERARKAPPPSAPGVVG